MKIVSVVGARPNFMKIAPFIREVKKQPQITHVLVHTGQHYDDRMSKSFFDTLGIPQADINLGIGSGTHGEQLGNTMIAFEKVLVAEKPDWVIVLGDVNATLSCSVIAKKLHVKVCHVEAGLRSYDERMPEEINRLVTDRLADLLLTPDELSVANLKNEGVPDSKIVFVGNIMIDTLDANSHKAKYLKTSDIIIRNLILESDRQLLTPEDHGYALVTLHRPSNVDDVNVLSQIVNFFKSDIVADLKILWPLHPRTKKQLKLFGLFDGIVSNPSIILLEPLGYIEMLRLNMGARIMLTDSGGLQEECTVLGTPCLTLRFNTERPITLKEHGGVSVLVGNDVERIRKEYYLALETERTPVRPPLWDGNTAQRCLKAILEYPDHNIVR